MDHFYVLNIEQYLILYFIIKIILICRKTQLGLCLHGIVHVITCPFMYTNYEYPGKS